MGRHSIPGPDEPADDAGFDDEYPPRQPAGRYGDQPADRVGDTESGYGATGYDEEFAELGRADDADGSDDVDDEEYGQADHWQPDAHADYDDLGYEQPGDQQPGYERPGYDERGDDEPRYAEPRYGDLDAPTRAFATPAGSEDRAPLTGPAHGGDWDGGEWTGSHRAIVNGRRGISVSVIVALVTVVVVVGAVIAWRFFGDALSSRSEAGAARCVAGEVAVAVIADPAIADHIRPLAEQYNETAAPVGDRCVKIGVKSASSDQVVDGFVGEWPGELGERPALWVPGSSVSEARLEAAAGAETVSDSRSLVSSPVVLAVRPQLKDALAQSTWASLPGLQNNATSLEGLKLPGWGSLKLALPRTGDSDATYLAAEAVAAASAPRGAPATAGSNAVNALLSAQPELDDDTAATAFDALLGDGDPATAPVHAVATTEQQLYQRGSELSDAKSKLASWLPPGPTAMADFPTVLLAGTWVSGEQASAASEFARFLRKPQALAELAKAGFRTDGATLPTSDVTEFGTLAAPLSVGDDAARATLANLVGTPAQSPAVTVLLDQSMDVNEGGRTRVANVAAALSTQVKALPANSAVGLWTFDGVAGRSEVTTGPLADPVNGQPRTAVLTSNLDQQVASAGGAVSFTTLRLVYTEANANFREGQPNSVLVITSGPHTDQSLDGAGLQEFVRSSFNQGRPVAINVIDFGGDPDRPTWEAVAQTSGGAYQNLSSSAGPDLTTALATMLG